MLRRDNLAVINMLLEYFRFIQPRPHLKVGSYERRVFRRVSDLQTANTALPTSSHRKPCSPIRWRHICGPAPLLTSCCGWDLSSLTASSSRRGFPHHTPVQGPSRNQGRPSLPCCSVSKAAGSQKSPGAQTATAPSLGLAVHWTPGHQGYPRGKNQASPSFPTRPLQDTGKQLTH